MENKHNDNELAGSFSLNALGDTEREDLLRQAGESATVRDEIDELQQTAALLGLSTDPVDPPPRVKARLMDTIRTTEQLPPVPPPETPAAPGTGRTVQRFFALAAGVLLLAAGGLGAVVLNQNTQQRELEQRLDALSSRQDELIQILASADVQSKSQTMDNGATVTLSYSATAGMMAVATAGMPELPSNMGYELWLISADGAASAGMLGGTEADGVKMISGSMEGVTHFGITVEPSTGSDSPTTEPIMVQEL
ncbi:anti-sigma factor [Glutamicibacter sp. MNS18]|uniref:anti-sigma factor n=1 Tax=Glutamicibacter sp. MNS18 TaxID=2989817 RepID=UPI0022358E51|nr:anti-sigma factor [Glutamicibacter sp. MNS18]MCW4465274.1 anti-sigma factor [Glutamicibacter sp. MNS18]